MNRRRSQVRTCNEPGCPEVAVRRGRCLEHARAADRKAQRKRIDETGTGTERGYNSRWDRLSRRMIRRQPWCTWCGETEDLTADHIVPLSRGGASSPANVQVLCRACNTRRRHQDERS